MNLQEARNTVLSYASDITEWVSNNGELLAGLVVSFFAAVIVITLLITAWKMVKRGGGLREMAQRILKQEQTDVSDAITEALYKLQEQGKLPDDRLNFYLKKIGYSADLTDLIPRKDPSVLKKFLKWKRYSTSEEAAYRRMQEAMPAPIPGPKPGEEVQPTTKEKADVTLLFKPGSAAA